MTNKMFEIAKEKDDGKFAKLGMKEYCATLFGVDIDSEAVLYIVDTYLECIEDCEFTEWLAGNYTSQPIILTRNDLNAYYSDLVYISNDLETIADLFMHFYNLEFYTDKISDCIYSTEYQNIINRTRINSLGMRMEVERLLTLHEKEILSEKDVESCIEIIHEYGYDIEKDGIRGSDYWETACNIEEKMNDIFEDIL